MPAETCLFAAWDLARFERFPHGRKAAWRRGGVTAIRFDQVEFFRRCWGWDARSVELWPEVLAFYAETGQAFRVDVDASECAVVEARLRASVPGLEAAYVNEVVSLDLDRGGREGGESAAPPGVVVRPAGPGEMQDFAEIYLECFEARPPRRDEALANLRALAGIPGWHPWLVWCDGRPAGGYSLFVQGGEAFLSSAATRPGFGGRGIQTHLIAYRLRQARLLGAHRAVSYALRDSRSLQNLLRAGFRVVDAKHTFRVPGQ